MQNSWRKRKNWDWAKQWASLFETILPPEVCEAALATCRITLRDKESTAAGGAWGFAVLTEMQTFGNIPRGVCTEVRKNHHWITLQAAEAADVILSCFGFSLDDVINHVGRPVEGEKITVSLCEVMSEMDADFALTNVVAVA